MIEEILREKGDDLAGVLAAETSLNAEQATGFLPVALHAVVEKVGALDLGALLGGGGPEALIDRLDVAGIARKAGLAEAEAQEGLRSVLPLVLEALKERAGAAGERLSGATASAGSGLFETLFDD